MLAITGGLMLDAEERNCYCDLEIEENKLPISNGLRIQVNVSGEGSRGDTVFTAKGLTMILRRPLKPREKGVYDIGSFIVTLPDGRKFYNFIDNPENPILTIIEYTDNWISGTISGKLKGGVIVSGKFGQKFKRQGHLLAARCR